MQKDSLVLSDGIPVHVNPKARGGRQFQGPIDKCRIVKRELLTELTRTDRSGEELDVGAVWGDRGHLHGGGDANT